MTNHPQNKSVIWDLPTRIFHWLLAGSFLLAWLSYDDNRFLYVHVFAGYVFFSLLVFRLIWGFIGTHYARFHSFAHDWKSVTDYLRGLLNGTAMRYIGHNPAGGYAIFAMLFFGFIIGVTGILTLAGEEGHGPLRGFVNYAVGIISHTLHTYLAWFMLAITAVHLIGVVVESVWHRENLIWTMINGKKDTAAGSPSIRGHHLLGLSIAVLVAVAALGYFRGYLVETADHLYMPYKGPELPDNALWRESCGECHFAFHPSLLPARSWKKIFAEQHSHFGDDLDLDQEVYDALLKFHLENSAEKGLTEPSKKILFHTPDNETPIRITETYYWVKKHNEIKEVYWHHPKVVTKSNCSGCHLDAKQGTYEDSDMRLPSLKDTPEPKS